MVEVLIGVNVVDAEGYARYRARIAPLLEAHGGAFGVDVGVAEVFRSPSDQPMNRLFTLRFPSVERLDAFFSFPAYLAARAELFAPCVSAMTQFGKYEVLG
jgi:uncharacterized protein (DUF1330 family)